MVLGTEFRTSCVIEKSNILLVTSEEKFGLSSNVPDTWNRALVTLRRHEGHIPSLPWFFWVEILPNARSER